MMGNKRKPESRPNSEPSPKIRRISTNLDQEAQRPSDLPSPSPPEQPETAPPESIRAPLTKKNLRRLEKMTSKGTKTTKTGETPTENSNSDGNTEGKNSRFSTTAKGFDEKFFENGNLVSTNPRSAMNPPIGLEDLEAYLNKSRASASPTSSQHEDFIHVLATASNEREIEDLYGREVLKHPVKIKDRDYTAKIDKQWVDFDKDVGFNNGLAGPKPDRTEGLLRTAFPPSVRGLGGAATLVNDDRNFVALPHYAAEFKLYGGNMKKAEIQAAYDGACMVYAHNKALRLIGEPEQQQQAAALTMTSDGLNWNVYAHHIVKDEVTGKVENYQHEVTHGRSLKLEDFKRTYKINRNAQDWGREQSTDLRDRMQRHYDVHGDLPTANGKSSTAPPPSSTKSQPPPPPSHSSKAGSTQSDRPAPSPVQSRTPRSDTSGASSKKSGSAGNNDSASSRIPSSSSSSSSAGASTGGGAATAAPAPPSKRRIIPPPTLYKGTGLFSNKNGKQNVNDTSMPPPPLPSDGGRVVRKPDGAPRRGSQAGSSSPAPLTGSRADAPGSRRMSRDDMSGRPPSRGSSDDTRSPLSMPPRPSSRASGAASDDSSRRADRRTYRDRDQGIQTLQHRRSDSPDRNRPPRPPRDRARDPVDPAYGRRW